jgi:anti-sigma factor RsiW
MRCQEAIRLIQAEGDGMASAGERAGLRDHLAGCAACRQVLAGHQALTAALAADAQRQVSDGFESRLFARIADAPARSPLVAWWRRLSFLASWRLAPALAATTALAAAGGIWVAIPRPAPDRSGYLAECVQQHRLLVKLERAQASTPEQEVVDYSIAQSTRGSISDTN